MSTYVSSPEGLLEAFMGKNAESRKIVFGNYRIEEDTLIYRASTSEIKSFYGRKSVEDYSDVFAQFPEYKAVDYRGCIVGDLTPESAFKAEVRKIRFTGVQDNIIAKKLPSGVLLGNASILPLIGRTVAWGNVSNNTAETCIQKKMRAAGFVMVPFNVFTEAKLDIMQFVSVQKNADETVSVKEIVNCGMKCPKWNDDNAKHNHPEFKMVPRHFTGSHLFSVAGTQFLFDIDRNEIKHGIFNPFLVKLVKPVKTIDLAYQSLKPLAVINAEKKGLKVLRQGEWFFIPTNTMPKMPKLTDKMRVQILGAIVSDTFQRGGSRAKYALQGVKISKNILDSIPQQLEIRVGKNRPNTIEMGFTKNAVTYGTGLVTHSGREHEPIKLKGWYIVVPNTSSGSFTITGDVD